MDNVDYQFLSYPHCPHEGMGYFAWTKSVDNVDMYPSEFQLLQVDYLNTCLIYIFNLIKLVKYNYPQYPLASLVSL